MKTRSWIILGAAIAVGVGAICVAVVSVAVISMGWADSCPSRVELVGTYSCRYDFAIDLISLNSDGSFTQTTKYYNGRILNNLGLWTYPSATDDLELTHALVIDNGFGQAADDPLEAVRRGAMWGPRARKSLTGRVYLSANEDVGLFYERQGNNHSPTSATSPATAP